MKLSLPMLEDVSNFISMSLSKNRDI
jgi:hypothetical protein